MRVTELQLQDLEGRIVGIAGGQVMACATNSPNQVAIYDANGAQINATAATRVAQALNRGNILIRTADSVENFDLHIMTPTGHWVDVYNVRAGDRKELQYSTRDRMSLIYLPVGEVTANGFTAGTEFDTGFDLMTGMVVLPDTGWETTTLEAARTIEIGLLSSESGGDADGFIDAMSTAAAVVEMCKSAATATRGALVGAGTLDRGYIVGATAKSLSFTWLAASTVAKGFGLIPIIVPRVPYY